MLNSLKSLSLSGDFGPNYVRLEWEAGDEGIRCPPTTHFIATIDDLTDVLDFDFEDIDGMDDDAGDVQNPPLTRQWTATSPNDIYMVDTPKETNGDEAVEDNPSGGKTKHGHLRRHSKPRHINSGPGDDSDSTKEEYSPDQPTIKQAVHATMGYLERDNYTPPSEDEVSLDNDEFGVPEDLVEQVRFRRRLIATAKSLQR